MTKEERAQFTKDIGSSLRQLHALTAPDSGISAFGGGPLRTGTTHDVHYIGPFDSEKAFYEHLYSRVPSEYHACLRETARDVHETPHRICLSQLHGIGVEK